MEPPPLDFDDDEVELEADDLVSIHNKLNTVICSPDKDVLYQNVGKHYNYGKAEFVEVNEQEEKWRKHFEDFRINLNNNHTIRS